MDNKHHTSLTADMVTDRAMWHLVIGVSARAMQVVLVPVSDTGQPLYHRTFLAAGEDPGTVNVGAFEAAVYDNPLLVQDGWASVRVVADEPRWMLMPAAMRTAPGLINSALAATYADANRDRDTYTFAIPGQGVTLAMALRRDLVRFILRTFVNPTIMHRMRPLLVDAFTSEGATPGQAHIHVTLDADGRDVADIVCVGKDGALVSATSYSVRHPNDVVYYATAVLGTLPEAQRDTAEVIVAGDAPMHGEVLRLLGQYVPNITSAIIEESLRGIPLPLLLSTQCA